MSTLQVELKRQYATSHADRQPTDVHSGEATVVTGSDDATMHRDPSGQKSEKDFDRNCYPGDFNEDSFRGSR